MTADRGRAGTPMPAFGVGQGGQYSDNQLRQIVAYILAVQEGVIPEIDAQAFVGRSGEDLFGDHCARCHGVNAEGFVGPQLWNLFERYGASLDDEAAVADVRQVIRDAVLIGRDVPGKAKMPSFAHELSNNAIEAIIDYIEGIQQTGGPRFGQIGGDPQPAAEDEDE
jgi:mono/diheme cytochrome c family protein